MGSVMSITVAPSLSAMMLFDTGNCYWLLSSIFFPQEQLGPDLFRPSFLVRR